jgi:hypothetical protein
MRPPRDIRDQGRWERDSLRRERVHRNSHQPGKLKRCLNSHWLRKQSFHFVFAAFAVLAALATERCSSQSSHRHNHQAPTQTKPLPRRRTACNERPLMTFSFEVLPSNVDLSSLRRALDENSSMPLERCKAFVSGIFGMSEFSYLSIVFGRPVTFAKSDPCAFNWDCFSSSREVSKPPRPPPRFPCGRRCKLLLSRGGDDHHADQHEHRPRNGSQTESHSAAAREQHAIGFAAQGARSRR